MAETILSTANLTKTYGSIKAVNDVSMAIHRGAIVGLVGKNGAGKTTLIRILTGLVKPTSGSFEILPGCKREGADIGAIIEHPSIYNNLSGMDNLIAQSKLLGLPVDQAHLTETLNLVDLDPSSKQKAKNYSLGMKQRLGIAMTLVGKPQLLILDEPMNGLDPEGIQYLRQILVDLCHKHGVTIIISSHILSELGKFATEYYIMNKGRMIRHVAAEELKEDALEDYFMRVINEDNNPSPAIPSGGAE